MVIYTLVEASTRNDAVATGKAVLDRLVRADPHGGTVFDYFVTFDQEGSTVAENARWGDSPVATRVDSDEVQEPLERGWDATKSKFQRNLKRVREALDKLSDDEIMRNRGLARHAFHQVGAYDGPSIFLYDECGCGIWHRGQLDRVLEESEELWIVPVDVHF
ncbi:hypothetical protein [Natrialbaceae archaeon AArc-T1-2]|uniref:hypothetical protein n=1 Tax=Natrialbaceae archaeon AArc-T1-2 TaxID=3053904 RepID=UPI00255AE6C7|nr:hypothetical protein [Natrialbaceae archaeon AArc-T1-2]WIV68893.1 hypothetical protein QQ977_17090 [Natrialbaceae archaeon AArc-T1-2]